MADERDSRPGWDVEVDAVQHFGTVAVAEAHVLETDAALDLFEVTGAGVVADLGLLVHHVHDLVERRDRREERVVELRKLLDRVEEVRQVEDERQQRSHREAAAYG